MADEQARQMDACCYTCGDIGVAEAIVTCSLCKEINEHMYCMRIYCEDYPTDWYCDECEPRVEPLPPESCPRGDLLRGSQLINSGTVCHDTTRSLKSRKLSNETRPGSVNWEKKVATGRTKFIPVNEAIKLSSGAPKTVPSKKVTRHSSPPQLKMGENIHGRTSIKPQAVPMESSAYRSGANFASVPSQELKHKKHGNVLNSRQQQQSKELRVQRPVTFIQAAPTSTGEHIQKEQTAVVINAIKNISPASLPSVSHPVVILGTDDCPDVEPVISNADNVNDSILPDVEPRTSDAENAKNEPRTSNDENLNSSILPYVEPRTSSTANCVDVSSSNPARCALWMGSFSIHHGFKHVTLNDPVYAHPPGKIRRKVYEYSKLMPKVLHFELFPCRELWTNLFQEYRLDRENIGFYFLPNASKRSEDYFSLLEFMIKKDLALRKQIADVELMLFPSTRLTLDCQRWNGKYFVWGLFRRKKQDEIARQDRALTLNIRPSDDVHESFDGDNNEVVDMDIDMIAGENVGKTDIAVRRDKNGRSSKESTATTASHGNVDALKGCPSLDVKMVQQNDYPPGFAEAYSQKFRNSHAL